MSNNTSISRTVGIRKLGGALVGLVLILLAFTFSATNVDGQDEQAKNQCDEVLSSEYIIGKPRVIPNVVAKPNRDGKYKFYIEIESGTRDEGIMEADDSVWVLGLSTLASLNRLWYVASFRSENNEPIVSEFLVVADFDGKGCSVINMTGKFSSVDVRVDRLKLDYE